MNEQGPVKNEPGQAPTHYSSNIALDSFNQIHLVDENTKLRLENGDLRVRNTRIADMNGQLVGENARLKGRIKELDERINDLTVEVAALAQSSSPNSPGGVYERLDRIEDRLNRLSRHLSMKESD
jgi:regulator of replication initiation timing